MSKFNTLFLFLFCFSLNSIAQNTIFQNQLELYFFETRWFWMLISFLLLIFLFLLIKKSKKRRLETEEFITRRTKKIFTQHEKIAQQKIKLEEEKEKTDDLLKNIFPEKIAKVLKNKGKIDSVYYQQASILFADIVGFSKITPNFTANELVENLNLYFKSFDTAMDQNRMMLVKTIGDCYLTVGGVPNNNKTNPINAVLTGLQMQEAVKKLKLEKNTTWDVRVGINTGELVAGVLDTKRPMFDIWGSSVNIASRVQDAGKPGMVNVSEATYRKIYPFFVCEERGEIDTKNVGKIEMYFVSRIKPELSQNEEGTIPNDTFWKYAKALEDSTADYISVTKNILNLLKEKLPENYTYHSVNHTLNVMRAVEKIGFGEKIFDEKILLLKTAALFHDTGFMDKYEENEDLGIQYAKTFLPKYGFTNEEIEQICDLIYSTKMEHKPTNLLEKIMKDADLDYLGRDDFFDISDKLKREFIKNKIVKNEEEFHQKQLAFLKNHTYFTKAAQRIRKSKKKENYKLAKNITSIIK